jgi:hypothetical protein
MSEIAPFAKLDELATHLREKLKNKKFLLLYAYNGIGETCLRPFLHRYADFDFSIDYRPRSICSRHKKKADAHICKVNF